MLLILSYDQCPADIELKKFLSKKKSESEPITFPFLCDNGNKIIIGENVSIKENCVFLDGPDNKPNGKITIGDHTLIGPYVQIYTSHHSLTSETERSDEHYSVTIGANCKIGRESILCPGAEVGNGCVIAAGSVVVENHPIPENCLAGGTPCKVIKQLEEGEDVDSYINAPKGLLTPKPSHYFYNPYDCYKSCCPNISNTDYTDYTDYPYIEPPFYFNHGSKIGLGKKVYINGNCTFFNGPDDGGITIGDYTRIGPSVQIYTSEDSLNSTLSNLLVEHHPKRYQPVKIGNNCWIGGGAIIFPGVKIGDCTTIGAGSVVTHDIPAGCLAVGNPCRVIQKSPY